MAESSSLKCCVLNAADFADEVGRAWRTLASLKHFFGWFPETAPRHLKITQYCYFYIGTNIISYSVRWQWVYGNTFYWRAKGDIL